VSWWDAFWAASFAAGQQTTASTAKAASRTDYNCTQACMVTTSHKEQHAEMKIVQRFCEVSQIVSVHMYLDKPLCSMEGVAMTTQGPMSSRCWEDLRWVTCLNMKGLEACTVQHMCQQAASQHCLHCLLCKWNVANLMISSIISAEQVC